MQIVKCDISVVTLIKVDTLFIDIEKEKDFRAIFFSIYSAKLWVDILKEAKSMRFRSLI